MQQGGKKVTDADIASARNAGATDVEIHDTVLIAAAFCMFNRYVDLGTTRTKGRTRRSATSTCLRGITSKAFPGISGLLMYRPETAGPLRELVEILLRGPSSLTPGEREIIASSVSWWNDCHFCHTSHGAAACAHLGKPVDFIDAIKAGLPDEALSAKMRALLQVAHQVQRGGKHVTDADIAAARTAGATDVEIHDTVLIAASFLHVQPLCGRAGHLGLAGEGEVHGDRGEDGA